MLVKPVTSGVSTPVVALTFGAVIVWFAVTVSNVTSLLVAIVKSLPDCVITMLSPLMNLTVLPPSTFSAVLPFATTFQAAKSLTCCSPAGVKLLKSWSAALSILPLVAASSLTVTSSPLATVVRPFSPLILNFTSPVLKDFSSVEPELPPKEILRAIAVVFLSILSLFLAISALLVAISPAFLVIAVLLSAIFCLFAVT